MLKDNIKENEIIVRDQEKENKQKLKEYQDTFNIMNKNRYQVTQDPTENRCLDFRIWHVFSHLKN
jgi:hypothetical protein